MSDIDYQGLLLAALPEVVLTATMLGVLAVDLLVMRGQERCYRRMIASALSAVGCVAALLVLNLVEGASAGGTMLVVDGMARLAQGMILVLTLFAVGLGVEQEMGDHIGEGFALMLLASIGMLLLVATEHLLMLFLALELVSLPLYILVGFNKRNPRSAEAALKYFLFGSVAAAFALFGFSWVYGVTGSIELPGVAAALRGKPLEPMMAVALVMVVMGFGFKIAAVPFHLWAPDTYQGAPTVSAAFVASSSKVASFVILAKMMLMGFAGAAGSGDWRDWTNGWVPLLAVLALLSMILGNLAALTQGSVKRLLAYSAVAHAGYTLVGLAANSIPGVVAVVYTSATYALAVLGAFGVIRLVEDGEGDIRLNDLAGLSRRAPILSFCLMLFLLSLAGIPPLAGFYGKFSLFAAAVTSGAGYGLLWLVVIAIIMSAVSFYYYVIVLKQVFVAAPGEARTWKAPGRISQVCVCAMALMLVLLGCLPNLLVGPLTRSLTVLSW